MQLKLDWGLLIPAARWRKSVTAATLRADLAAGFTNATVVLPQGIAFAAIAGLPPEYGLYTAMITPVVAALFGSSMVMVSGPTTAISAVVFATLSGVATPGSQEFVELALLLTVLVGIIQFGLGIVGLGRLVAFVSHSVMLGFTAAAALLIATSQIGGALGVEVERGGSVVERVLRAVEAIPQANWHAIVIAATAFGVAVIVRAIRPTAPNFIIALIIASAVGWYLDAGGHGVAMVGEVPSITPQFAPPPMGLERIATVAEGAFAIALIGLLEAIAIGRAFAYRTGSRFDANQEIVGQGLSNFVGGMFQAYPGSGSFTRSGINFEAGAKTPMSAIFSALFLLGLLVLLAPLASQVPIPALAGIIMLVAWKLVNFGEIWKICRTSRTELAIIAATFLAGTLGELDFAIYVGVILSLMIFLSKTSRPSLVISAPDEKGVFRDPNMFGLKECPQMMFVRIDGPLYFGSAEEVERGFRHIERTRQSQHSMILILKGVGDIDLSGAQVLVDEAKRRKMRGGGLYVVTRYPPLLKRLKKLNVIDAIGEENIFANKKDAIEATVGLAKDSQCATCTARLFRECAGKAGASEAAISAAQ